jgi:transposase
MQVVHSICCGLDVHKRTVVACLLTWAQGQPTKELKTFETTSDALRKLADWLQDHGCRQTAIESTGVYWKPVFNILEARGISVLLANAQHIRNVPGRKTDAKDAEWIAELLQMGLINGSFVPPKEIRELRELTRYRKTLIQQRANQCNRIQKLLETCNIKLASVATDILGASGWDMLNALADGNATPEQMAQLARKRLRSKIPQLIPALDGVLSDTQRWLLREELKEISRLDEAIARLDQKVEELTRPFAKLIGRLTEMPGVNQRVAEVIISEIGIDMSRFPTAKNLVSWAGMCPGNHRSAGKRQSGRSCPGNKWLRGVLTEAGWAAGVSKDSAMREVFQRIARRRGAKRATRAVGHHILAWAHFLLAHPDTEFIDPGPDYYKQQHKEQIKNSLLRKLRELGVEVTVQGSAA